MNDGSLPKPVVFSSANDVPGMRLAHQAGDLQADLDGDRPGAAHGARRYVVHDAAVGADRQAVVADVVPQLGHPADRAAGDEHDGDAEVLDGGQRGAGPVGDGAVGVQQGAVEVGRHQLVHEAEATGRASISDVAVTASPEPPVELEGDAVVVHRLGHVVGRLLDLEGRLPHRDAAAGPPQHLDVVAPVADRQDVRLRDAELARRPRPGGGLGDALGRDVEPRGPADEVVGAVQPELLGERQELLLRGVRVADDHAGDRLGDELLDGLEPHLAGDLAVGEVPVEPVADADLLDGDSGVRHLLQQHLHDLAGVERLRRAHLDGRVAESHRAVARDREHRRPSRGRPSRSQTSVMPNVERPVASTTCAPASYARLTASTTAAVMTSSTGTRGRDVGEEGAVDVEGDQLRGSQASSRVPPAPGPRGPAGRAAAPRGPAPSRPPAGASRGSRRWCAGSRRACRSAWRAA